MYKARGCQALLTSPKAAPGTKHTLLRHFPLLGSADTFLDQTIDISFTQKPNRIKLFGDSIRWFWHTRELRGRLFEYCLPRKAFNDHRNITLRTIANIFEGAKFRFPYLCNVIVQ